MDRVEGLEIVRAAVADCLAVDIAEVTPDARIIPDLGADSLDLLDLIFTLEKRFGVKLREGTLDLFSRPESFAQEELEDGFLRPERVETLKAILPAIDRLPVPHRILPRELPALVTVESLWRMIEPQLAKK
jgi:acyl carrier protein